MGHDFLSQSIIQLKLGSIERSGIFNQWKMVHDFFGYCENHSLCGIPRVNLPLIDFSMLHMNMFTFPHEKMISNFTRFVFFHTFEIRRRRLSHIFYTKLRFAIRKKHNTMEIEKKFVSMSVFERGRIRWKIKFAMNMSTYKNEIEIVKQILHKFDIFL